MGDAPEAAHRRVSYTAHGGAEREGIATSSTQPWKRSATIGTARADAHDEGERPSAGPVQWGHGFSCVPMERDTGTSFRLRCTAPGTAKRVVTDRASREADTAREAPGSNERSLLFSAAKIDRQPVAGRTIPRQALLEHVAAP